MLGTIGGILVIVGTTIKAIDDLTNKKQEGEKYESL